MADSIISLRTALGQDVDIKLVDNGDGTYSLATSGGGGGGGGGDASAANQAIGNTSLDNIDDKTPGLGQQLAADSSPIVLTAAQLATLTPPDAIVGFATAANQISGDQVSRLSGSAAQAAAGIVAKTTPFGELTVTAPVVPQFVDNFDAAIDTTDRWTLSGTTLPANVNGSITLDLTAANSVSSVAISQPTFSPTLQAFVLAAQLGVGAQQTNPNAHRFFGQGVVTAYASATPLTNGFGVEVDLTGALNFVVYIAGVRYVVNSTNAGLITAPGGWAANMTMSTYGQTITWPASGVLTVVMRYVNGTVFFYTASGSGVTFDIPVGVASFVPAAVQLPIRFAAITTPAVSTVLATTFTGSGLVLGGPLGNIITDPTFPFRGATVKKASTAAATTDLPLVVALHPSSPLIPGTAATNLGKAKAAAGGATDTGVAIWGIARDGPALATQAAAVGAYLEFANDRTGTAYVRPRPMLTARATADLQVKNAAGYLHSISIAPTQATPVAGLLTVYDSLTETGTVLFSTWITSSATPVTVSIGCIAATGIYIGFDATLAGVQVQASYL